MTTLPGLETRVEALEGAQHSHDADLPDIRTRLRDVEVACGIDAFSDTPDAKAERDREKRLALGAEIVDLRERLVSAEAALATERAVNAKKGAAVRMVGHFDGCEWDVGVDSFATGDGVGHHLPGQKATRLVFYNLAAPEGGTDLADEIMATERQPVLITIEAIE